MDSEKGMARLQVKAEQKGQWPRVQGPQTKMEFLVLVDFEGTQAATRPEFYVLDADDWAGIVSEQKRKHPGIKIREGGQIIHPDGWKGLNLRVHDVAQYKSAWKKIRSI